MLNEIGIPPLEGDPHHRTPKGRSATAAHAALNGHDDRDAHKGNPDHYDPRLRHPTMDPKITEAARHDDLPDLGTSFTHPITERDADASWYVGILVAALVILLVVLMLAALF
jgi:hypothetical protein